MWGGICKNLKIAENIFHIFNIEGEPELLRKAVMEDDRDFEYFGYWYEAAVKSLIDFSLHGGKSRYFCNKKNIYGWMQDSGALIVWDG